MSLENKAIITLYVILAAMLAIAVCWYLLPADCIAIVCALALCVIGVMYSDLLDAGK
jgi:hypothetical protein